MSQLPDSPASGPLSAKEYQRLSELEQKLETELEHGYTLGEILAEIRDSKLYREKSRSFEEYVAKEWSLYARTAWNHIAAWKAKQALPTLALGYSQHVLLGSLAISQEDMDELGRKIEGRTVRESRNVIKQWRYGAEHGESEQDESSNEHSEDEPDTGVGSDAAAEQEHGGDAPSEDESPSGVAVTDEDYQLQLMAAVARASKPARHPLVREVADAAERLVEQLKLATEDVLVALNEDDREALQKVLEAVAEEAALVRNALALTSP